MEKAPKPSALAPSLVAHIRLQSQTERMDGGGDKGVDSASMVCGAAGRVEGPWGWAVGWGMDQLGACACKLEGAVCRTPTFFPGDWADCRAQIRTE